MLPVCVQKSETEEAASASPSIYPAVHPRTVLSLSLGIESNPPNSQSNNDVVVVVELEKESREAAEKNIILEGMQKGKYGGPQIVECCRQKSIQDREGGAHLHPLQFSHHFLTLFPTKKIK